MGKAVPALRAVLASIAEARDRGVREADVERAKASLIAGWRHDLGTAEGLASMASAMLALGLPLEATAEYPARIQAVTRDDVRRAAARWLAEGALRVVVVGPHDVEGALGGLGLGKAERRDVWGSVVRE
jgi:zinc protease